MSLRRRSASTRRSGGGVPGSVAFHTARSSVPMENDTPTSVRSDAAASSAASRRIRVDFVRMLNGFLAAAQRLHDAPGQVVLALGVLVGVRVGAHGDVVAAPLGRAQLGSKPFHRVDLHHDLAFEVGPDAQPEVVVGGPGEAVHAGVAAASIRVDRVPEGHPALRRHRVDDAAGVHVEELHPGVGALPDVALGHLLVGEERAALLALRRRPPECHLPYDSEHMFVIQRVGCPQKRPGQAVISTALW